ncbi:hypothetical protein [Bacillus ndiopicus]|uniref:hypothetical protein n=1 Tax=Bacillus ndiopicus TaxID=1347368 RepID=UPI0005A8884C|nr:hypothetical protein [Bacillus ndiopicus]
MKKASTTIVVLVASLIIICSPIKASAALIVVEAPTTGVSSVANFDLIDTENKSTKPMLLKSIKNLMNKIKNRGC